MLLVCLTPAHIKRWSLVPTSSVYSLLPFISNTWPIPNSRLCLFRRDLIILRGSSWPLLFDNHIILNRLRKESGLQSVGNGAVGMFARVSALKMCKTAASRLRMRWMFLQDLSRAVSRHYQLNGFGENARANVLMAPFISNWLQIRLPKRGPKANTKKIQEPCDWPSGPRNWFRLELGSVYLFFSTLSGVQLISFLIVNQSERFTHTVSSLCLRQRFIRCTILCNYLLLHVLTQPCLPTYAL